MKYYYLHCCPHCFYIVIHIVFYIVIRIVFYIVIYIIIRIIIYIVIRIIIYIVIRIIIHIVIRIIICIVIRIIIRIVIRIILIYKILPKFIFCIIILGYRRKDRNLDVKMHRNPGTYYNFAFNSGIIHCLKHYYDPTG